MFQVEHFPASFHPVDDFSSHRPVLWRALVHFPAGPFVELGCGAGSTPLLKEYCDKHRRFFFSIETKLEYAILWGPNILCVDSWDQFLEIGTPYIEVLFVDSHPGEERAKLINAYKNKTEAIIVHDTETSSAFAYPGVSESLAAFKYRCDLVIEGMPQTTIVSDFHDFSSWKGEMVFPGVFEEKAIYKFI